MSRRNRPTGWALALLLGSILGSNSTARGQEQDPQNPFASDPNAPATPREAPRPERRTWNVRDGKFAMAFDFVPGIPEPARVVEVTVRLGEIPEQRHPQYGLRIPIQNARVVVAVTGPSGLVGRFLTHSPPLAGDRYAFHVTPPKKGIYGLRIEGTTEDGRSLSAHVKMPVGVWPLPKNLQGTGAPAVGGLTPRRPVIKK